ncbi:MAG: Fe(2+) transporter permease subunit FeoB [Spirochaetota bacterium]
MNKTKTKNQLIRTGTVGVVGNPNSGKTTLFNGLTGSNQRIGNWPGVTIEKKVGNMHSGPSTFDVVDLPGIYSLSAASEDERIARDYVLSGEADLVVNIVDATNLERNLFLTVNLIEMRVPVLVVLNMMDLAELNRIEIDIDELSRELGVPVIGITAVDRKDIRRVEEAIAEYAAKKHRSTTEIEYPNELEEAIEEWLPSVTHVAEELGSDSRWVCVKLLEQDDWITEKVVRTGTLSDESIKKRLDSIEKILSEPSDVVVAQYRYGFIHGLVKKSVARKPPKMSATERIDRITMNRFLGIPIFLGVMYLMFWVVINVGGAFIDFFDILFGAVFVEGFGALLTGIGSPEWLVTVLAGGVGGGIQTVSTFIPIIFMMFLMLSLLEDSGYMARAAFVMDRFMRFLGLPGKAFVPMIVGFGCTVPAVMSSRTLESKRDRYLTVFITPLMSCGARLPVYALFAAAFFPRSGGVIVFSVYFAGIILAVLSGLLLKRTLFRGEISPFVMELPPYHAPRIRHIMNHTWLRLRVFLFRAGKVIVIAIMFLAFLNSLGTDGSFGNEDTDKSVLSKIGRAITPVFTPMGIEEDNWPATVGIFTGLFAKEAVVGTLSSLYSQLDTAEAESSGEGEQFRLGPPVREAFASIPEGFAGIFGGLADPLGAGIVSGDEENVAAEVEADRGIFSTLRSRFGGRPAGAYSYLLFVLIYFPCIAAFGAIVREVGQGFGWLSVGYLTVLGWITATLFYQIAAGGQLVWILVPVAMTAGIVVFFSLLGRRMRAKIKG